MSSKQKRLQVLWSLIDTNENQERWSRVLQRMCRVEVVNQYLEDRAKWREQLRNKARRRKHKTGTPPVLNPIEEYIDICFPTIVVQEGSGISADNRAKRARAKKRFENVVQTSEPWVRFNQRYGFGIMPLIPDNL